MAHTCSYRTMDFRSLQPSQYLSRFLENGVRTDGRVAGASRKITVNSGSVTTADGSALIRMGGTVVMCGVKAELSSLPSDSPSQGVIVCNVELPPCCSPGLPPGPPPPEAQALSQLLQDSLLKSGCVDLTQCCIAEGKLRWVLYADVVCLCDDGNVTDACMLAATTALANTLLPAVETGGGSTLQVSLKIKTPLPLGPLPVSVSYGLFHDHALLDPTADEEAVCTGRVTITILPTGDITAVTKTGTPDIPPKLLLQLCKQAQEKAKALIKLVRTALTHPQP